MGDYKPPFTVTDKMISYISSISEKIGRITVTNSLVSKPHLRKNNRIQSIHSSLKIEANSLSLGQVRDIIDGKAVLGEQKEIQEVKNAYTAYERFSEIDPYNIKSLKQFHGIMTKYVVEESGDFRCGEEGVFNGGQCIFMAPPAQFVPQLMEELFDWMKKEKDNLHPLILGCVFHYEFVFIHPFSDGNGRMSRLLTLLLLYQNGYEVGKYISIEKQIEKTKDAYYDVLERIDYGWHEEENDPTPFIKYMLQVILACYKEFEERVGLMSEKNRSTVYDVVKNYVTEKIGKFTGAEVIAACPIGSRSAVLNALNKLTKEEIIVKCGSGRGTFYVRKDAMENENLPQ